MTVKHERGYRPTTILLLAQVFGPVFLVADRERHEQFEFLFWGNTESVPSSVRKHNILHTSHN